MTPLPYKEILFTLMKNSDRSAARQLIEGILHDGMPMQAVLTDVLDPALAQLGTLWEKKAISLSEAFVASKIAEDILLLCLPDPSQANQPAKGPVVIGNIEEDFHSLGRRIIGSFLTASGWDVHDLGNDVPAEQFVETAQSIKAPVIGVSAMMQTTALNIRRVRNLIDEQGLRDQIKLAVGGAVFNWRPQLVEEVGGDGTATNAAEVDALFMRLKAATEASA